VSCVPTILAAQKEVSREQLIPLLQEIQKREGYLSQDTMTELAEALDTPVASVFGVATFYNQFRFAALGEHVIEICRGTACHVKQSLTLAQHLQRRLKLRPDGNSPDGRFSVIKVACLGACSIAPVIKLDGEFYGHLTVEKLHALLDGVDNPAVPAAAAAPAARDHGDGDGVAAAALGNGGGAAGAGPTAGPSEGSRP
jgi:NADH-quinone oxidoreductase subunit E